MKLRDELNGYLRLPRTFFGILEAKDALSDVGVLGIPYDITSSYQSGTRFGPDAIRAATDSERSHSFPLTIDSDEFSDETPLTKRITLEDIGDLEVVSRMPEAAMFDISEAVAKLATLGSHLLFLGGDHFVTYPILRGLKRVTDATIGIVFLDSHADFYEDVGGYQLSHGTTLRRLVTDKIIDIKNIVAHDLRTTLPEQRKELASGGPVQNYTISSFSKLVKEVASRVDWLYISVDMDVLKPEIAPGVSHPESGGLDMSELVTLLRIAFETGKVRFADVVELNPIRDSSELASIAARDIVKAILTGWARQKEYK
ncbi:MAG: arginase family protein [Candidatus Thorarchaeota archaeon]